MKTKNQSDRAFIEWVSQYYEKIFPGNPFEYFFLEDYYNTQYKADELLGRVIGIFAFLAVFVTCLGIFAMSSFLAFQRRKEFGIRKILGAMPMDLIVIMTREFLVLIGVSFLISTPLVYWGIVQWLSTFAYNMYWTVWPFFFPLILVSVVTLLTLSYNIAKVAVINPVESIKHE